MLANTVSLGDVASPPMFTAPGEHARKTGQMLPHPKAHRATDLTNEFLQVSYEDLFLHVSASCQFHLFFFSPAFLLCLLKSGTHTPLPQIRKGLSFQSPASGSWAAEEAAGLCWPLGARPRHGPAGACGHVVSVPASPSGGAREDWALRTNIRTPRCFFLRFPHCPPWPDSICHHQSSRLQNKLWVNTELQGVAGREGWARGGAAESRAVTGVTQAA